MFCAFLKNLLNSRIGLPIFRIPKMAAIIGIPRMAGHFSNRLEFAQYRNPVWLGLPNNNSNHYYYYNEFLYSAVLQPTARLTALYIHYITLHTDKCTRSNIAFDIKWQKTEQQNYLQLCTKMKKRVEQQYLQICTTEDSTNIYSRVRQKHKRKERQQETNQSE